MAAHTASSLFQKNMESATHCLNLFDGVEKLKPKGVDLTWILRAGVVFVASAVDTYFHDKIKYRVGKFSLTNLPPALAKFEVRIAQISAWEGATRKGNVLRNWVTDELSTVPLQSPERIADSLKLAGIDSVWATIEPNNEARAELLGKFNELIRRRNQIAHEGDRGQSRKSGKKLRTIDRDFLKDAIGLANSIVNKIETAFPK